MGPALHTLAGPIDALLVSRGLARLTQPTHDAVGNQSDRLHLAGLPYQNRRNWSAFNRVSRSLSFPWKSQNDTHRLQPHSLVSLVTRNSEYGEGEFACVQKSVTVKK